MSVNSAPGGADRDRTGDLLLAKQALSQLSYGPKARCQRPGIRRPPRDAATLMPDPCPLASGLWWAREDLNFRPHAYQARALTN